VSGEKSLSTIEKILFLKSVDLFAHASIEELGRIAALTEEVRFEAGATILREGEPVDAIYLILRGRAVVEKNGVRLRELGETQGFATVAALDLLPAEHTVTSLEPLQALKLEVGDFHEILSQDYALVRAVFRVLGRLIREADSS
jgi:cAMP-dependent protein kinase regulator